MTSRVQAQRFTTAGQAPAGATRQPGELWTNAADLQLGLIDASRTAQKLVAVRYFSTAANYVAGDHVIQAGTLYAAKAAITAGAFNPAQWLQVSAVGSYLPLAGGALSGPLSMPSLTVASDTSLAAVPGPWNVYLDTGDTGHQAKMKLYSSDPGNHPTVDMASLAIEHRPVGSGAAGPAYTDAGLSISAIKHNWQGSPALGQMDAIDVVIRQSGPSAGGVSGAGSDCCAFSANIENVLGTGYASVLEATCGNLTPGTWAQHKFMGVQICAMDGVADNAIGLHIIAQGGQIDNGILVQAVGASHFNGPFQYIDSGSTKFNIDTNGGVYTNTGLYDIAGDVIADSAAWLTYTPTVTPGAGSLGAHSATGRYKKMGRTVFFQVNVSITANGSASNNLVITVPIQPTGFYFIIPGRELGVTGKMLQGEIIGYNMAVSNYDNTYPGVDGAVIVMTGSYESAA